MNVHSAGRGSRIGTPELALSSCAPEGVVASSFVGVRRRCRWQPPPALCCYPRRVLPLAERLLGSSAQMGPDELLLLIVVDVDLLPACIGLAENRDAA